jgi:hypothetical protein
MSAFDGLGGHYKITDGNSHFTKALMLSKYHPLVTIQLD